MKYLKQKNHLKKQLVKRFLISILLNLFKIFSQEVQILISKSTDIHHPFQNHTYYNFTQSQSPIIFETLSLSTKQQSNDNILLQYSDSSGKTKSVNVVIRTEQKELFSGTFFTSMFETTVNDATGHSLFYRYDC